MHLEFRSTDNSPNYNNNNFLYVRKEHTHTQKKSSNSQRERDIDVISWALNVKDSRPSSPRPKMDVSTDLSVFFLLIFLL